MDDNHLLSVSSVNSPPGLLYVTEAGREYYAGVSNAVRQWGPDRLSTRYTRGNMDTSIIIISSIDRGEADTEEALLANAKSPSARKSIRRVLRHLKRSGYIE